MSLFAKFNRPRPIPLLFSVTGIGLMVLLSIWQIQRLTWKEELMTRIEHANTQNPLTELPAASHIKESEFYLISLNGHYLPEHQFHIAARYHNHELGYHVFTPFELADGTLILVNRGWVPAKEKLTYAESNDLTGEQTILAQIRTGNDRNHFTPPNQPKDNIWYGRDVTEIGEHAGITLYDAATFDLTGERSVEHLPVPSNGKIILRNDHLSYAITWFAIGIGMLIITLLYHRKKPGE